MGRLRKSARILKWRGDYFLFWHDYLEGKDRRTKCVALGATNDRQRQALVRDFRLRELRESAEARRRGGELSYSTPFFEAIAMFGQNVERRRRLRKKNPNSAEGLSEGGAREIKDTLKRFCKWLESTNRSKVTTGKFDGLILREFFQFLSGEKTKHGSKEVFRSPATINKHKANLRAMINELAEIRPPLFPDATIFKKALKRGRVDQKPPSAFSSEELSGFLSLVLKRENPRRKVQVKRVKGKGIEEVFDQTAFSNAATPLSQLFLLLALTGCRLGEALKLRWKDVDLEQGRITFYATKTSMTRILPLVGAIEGEVAPNLLALLRLWRKADKKRLFVLPHREGSTPKSSKKAWAAVNKEFPENRFKPQALRQNFCTYAASCGIPASVAAHWQGHGTAVAERWYRSQILNRDKGKTLEKAMGLADLISLMTLELAAKEQNDDGR